MNNDMLSTLVSTTLMHGDKRYPRFFFGMPYWGSKIALATTKKGRALLTVWSVRQTEFGDYMKY